MNTKKILYFSLEDVWPVILVLIVSGVGVAYGLQVSGEVRDEICTDAGKFPVGGRCQNHATNASQGYTESEAFNGTVDSITGVKKFPEKFDTLATVILAAIVIGVLVRYLAPGRM